MLSLADSLRLLKNAGSEEGLRECAAALGFRQCTPVGLELQKKLGIAGIAESFSICEAGGILRAITVSCSEQPDPRQILQAVAVRLSAAVPHLLWIVLSSNRTSHVGIAVWKAGTGRPRLYALVAELRRISESDAQTFCALAAITTSSESLTHLRWTEILGREAITIRFFRALRAVIDRMSESLDSTLSREKASELSLICVSRLLFLSFIETKGWLDRDHDFLSNTFIQCMTAGGRYHHKVLNPLFFGTLNTPIASRAVRAKRFGRIPFLNGGLFGRSPVEREHRFEFSDEVMGYVFGDLLTRYRFSGHEQSADFSDAAIDPEILGRAFESLMQSGVRKATGAFYTPYAVVHRVADAALEVHLEKDGIPRSSIDLLLTGNPPSGAAAASALQSLTEVRILDPACGSGAFLVYLLEKIAMLRALCGENASASDRRRRVLANSIFGVDINPTAVWLCELRLWLSVVVETESPDPIRVVPLPNLDRNIRVGDSLRSRTIGRPGAPSCASLEVTRRRYVRAVGTRKKALARVLEKMERGYALSLMSLDLEAATAERADLLAAARSPNLFGERPANETVNARLAQLREQRKDRVREIRSLQKGGALPFSFETHFADAMHRGGFDLVVGNPPWVRLHEIPKVTRDAFKSDFELCRGSGWELGANRARVGRGFAHQLDLSALFVERSLNILRENGSISMLLPAKLWKSLAGGSVRSLLSRSGRIRTLEDFSAAKAIFDATTYPSLLVATRNPKPHETGEALRVVVHRRSGVLHWEMSRNMLPLDNSPGSPWLLVPPEVRSAFDRVASNAIPLADSHFGPPRLGVKTGLNEAFIVKDESAPEVENWLLRKVIKGDQVSAWAIKETSERIIWTHGPDGVPLRELPPRATQWFQNWKKKLGSRVDARNRRCAWEIFRTEAANYAKPRVIWSDIGQQPRAAVIRAGDESVPLNTCYVIACKAAIEAHALAALINSPLVSAWLSIIAEPAQGGYNRYLGWTMAMLPIPRRWDVCREALSKLYLRAERGNIPHPSDLFESSLLAYGIREEDVQDLMIWAEQ